VKRSLKEIFGLREMAINVPDKDAPALQKIIDAAVQGGQLPAEAAHWMATSKAAQASSEPQASGEPKAPRAKGTKQNPVQAAPPQMSPGAKADLDKSTSAWAKLGGADYVNPAKSTPPPVDLDLDDPWFKNDPDKKKRTGPPPIPAAALNKKSKKPLAPHLPAPKSATQKVVNNDPNKPTDWSKDKSYVNDFPDMPAPQSANADVSNADDYKSPFAGLGLGTGGSSWDTADKWMQDPEKMPHAGGGSQKIPRSPEGGPEDVLDIPGKLPKKPKLPSPVGAPWSPKQAGEKKPGMLSKIFGKKKKES
jgi:hypothetical protein